MNAHCEMVVNLTFKELERDVRYEGILEVKEVQLDFQLTFESSRQASEEAAMAGRDPLRHVSLEYFNQGKQVNVSNIGFFDNAVYMGLSIYIHKRETGCDATAPVKSPVVVAEEMGQFPTPISLFSYVRELNGLSSHM
ncbi:hypothetical protein COU14_00220 [Candidatus Kaiserbacteria bacterium CG10_big_fil_rev_8_21_14_0_10_44_10]|uniref:Uncharacterized protein n=1 Tax=Candidatus Kaiserbacteria bacterium CG10_big_fil_rev_8_21_14_0_10_44_10 TaxID=1974606 RepID=A0A2H0UIG6_9BACT|nr:MAG: hypothetical protein COU14_00220 [Candidatus Kaiserbacteria bacterium CG10_big_fil_rev_8_21_14_0_10_44_10]